MVMGFIRARGSRGLQKQALIVTLITSTGKEIPLAVAETPVKLEDRRRKKKNKRYIELARFGRYPYLAITQNVVTGRLSWVFRGGQHHYWLPLDDYDKQKLLDFLLYSYTLEYKSIGGLRAVNITIPETVRKLRMRVKRALRSYKEHLKAKRRLG